MTDYGLENLITVSHAALENQTLRYLDLSWCAGAVGGSGGWPLVLACMRATSQPRAQERHGADDCGFFPLCVCVTLRDHENRSNRLTEVSGKILARLIAANTPLETLRLGCNELHDNAAYEIASALMDNETLVELDLSFNGLTDGALSVRGVPGPGPGPGGAACLRGATAMR